MFFTVEIADPVKRLNIYVVGHSPPPVTGENLCRQQLITTIKELGGNVNARARLDVRNFFFRKSVVWILAGAKTHGHLRDFLLISWWLLMQNMVTIYVHNISWRYFHQNSWFWRLWGVRVRFVVLTDGIRDALHSVGLNAERLNNTLSDGAEQGFEQRPFVPRLLWMSAVTEEKGFPVAYEAFRILKSKNSRWRFDVYGGGPLAVPDCFPEAHFHGFVAGVSKEAAFKGGGILFLPSRYVNETQPLAVIEALNYSLPFVSSDIGGLPDMLGCEKTCSGVCLPSYASPSDWAEAILLIASDYTAYNSSAFEVYSRFFSRASFRERLRKLLGLPNLVGSSG